MRHVLSIATVSLALCATVACQGPSASADRTAGGQPDPLAESGRGETGMDAGPLQPSRPLPRDVVLLYRAAITDPGVIAPGTALSVLLPQGWEGRGGVAPGRPTCDPGYVVNWTAVSPDGVSTMAIFPTESWSASTYGRPSECLPAAFTSAREYLEHRVERGWPGARVLEYADRQDFATSAIAYAEDMQQRLQQMGMGNMQVRVEGGEVLFAFEQDGREMRGTIGVTAIIYTVQNPNPMGGPPLTIVSGATLGTFGATAPEGQLDFTLVEATRRSIVPDAAWLQQLFALQAERGKIEVEGTRQRAAIIVAGGAAATRSNIETFRRMTNFDGSRGEIYPGADTDDRMQRRSIEAIRGVNTFADPVSNAAVQLDHSFGHAWRVTNKDAYILTKDPNFNPGQYGIQATQMKVIP